VRQRITIADVAREAGVSTQTVSRVVNNKDSVRPETRRAVLEVIERLGYQPNSVARSLATNRTLTLGVVVSDISNPYFADVVRGAEDAARERGYHVFLCNTDQDLQREVEAIRALQGRQVDGVVLCSPRLPEEELMELFQGRQEFVLVGREWIENAVGSVRSDSAGGVGLVVEHMVTRGLRKLAFAAGRPGGPGHRIRLAGFKEAIRAAGLDIESAVILPCATGHAGGYQAASELIEKHPDVEGLICFNDLVAIGALRACVEHGVRVPEELAVAGIGDIALASLVQPQLTTVSHPRHGLGVQAVSMLIDHLSGKEHEREILLKPELIVRASAP